MPRALASLVVFAAFTLSSPLGAQAPGSAGQPGSVFAPGSGAVFQPGSGAVYQPGAAAFGQPAPAARLVPFVPGAPVAPCVILSDQLACLVLAPGVCVFVEPTTCTAPLR